ARGMLGILLLLGGCAAAVCWTAKPGATSAPQPPGIDLRASGPAPKFNNTSAETPKMPAPLITTDKPKIELPPEPVLPKPPEQAFVPVPPPLMVPPKLPQEKPTLLLVEYRDSGSLACSCFHDVHRGESPMKRNWNIIKVAVPAVVALVLTPLPAAAQVTNKELKDAIDALSKKVEDNHTKVLSSQVEIMNDLMKIQANLKALNDTSDETKLKVQTMQGEMAALDAKVKKLQVDLEKAKFSDGGTSAADKIAIAELRGRLDKIEMLIAKLEEGRVSKSLPVNTGRILLANMYPEVMLFVINDVAYRVEPGTTKAIENVTPGVFKYEVISGSYGSVRTNRPTLEPGKTYTITVR
ncbi:MAG TPA: hypothetical protein VE988_22135, partial [Gemmataceae bacterium]|nr:hypothetical protein [Gemmataceae bacterium]